MPHAAGIHYRVSNAHVAAPPVVLIHGAGGNLWHWPPEIRHLENWPVYALDLPGHGESAGDGCRSIAAYAGQVLSWMEALALPPVVLTGHSMGGAITLQVALAAPGRVCGLGLVGTGARLRVSPEILEAAATPQGFPSAVDRIMRWAFHPHSEADLKALARARMLQVPQTVLHADFAACDAFDVREAIPGLEVPAVVICGQDDHMTPPRFSEYLAATLPQARLHLIPQAGHMVMLEQPQAVAEALRAFLVQVSAA